MDCLHPLIIWTVFCLFQPTNCKSFVKSEVRGKRRMGGNEKCSLITSKWFLISFEYHFFLHSFSSSSLSSCFDFVFFVPSSICDFLIFPILFSISRRSFPSSPLSLAFFNSFRFNSNFYRILNPFIFIPIKWMKIFFLNESLIYYFEQF